jgi:hypothetical protein
MKSYFGVPKLPLTVSLTVAALSIGSLLGGLCLGAWPAANPWMNWRNIRVFRAAPSNSTRTGPEKEKSVNWKLPPPYLKTEPLNAHRTHSAPSTWKAKPETPISVKWPDIGGTAGTPGPATAKGIRGGSCAEVDVWLPESARNAVATPSANDTNAIVTLDIKPPSEMSGNCAIWLYHYGKPPTPLYFQQIPSPACFS